MSKRLKFDCSVKVDLFCYVCGRFTIKTNQRKIDLDTIVNYESYFGMALTDSGKPWAPSIICVRCKARFSDWKRKKQIKLEFSKPMEWYDNTLVINHQEDCYFCMSHVSGKFFRNYFCSCYHYSLKIGKKQKDRRKGYVSASHVSLPIRYKDLEDTGSLIPLPPNPDRIDFERLEHRVRVRLNIPRCENVKKIEKVNDNIDEDTGDDHDDNDHNNYHNDDDLNYDINEELTDSNMVFTLKKESRFKQVSILSKADFDSFIKKKRLSIRATLEEATFLKSRGMLAAEVKLSQYKNRSGALKELYTRDPSTGWWYAPSVEKVFEAMGIEYHYNEWRLFIDSN